MIAASLSVPGIYFLFRDNGREVTIKADKLPFVSDFPLNLDEVNELKTYLSTRTELDPFKRLFNSK